jgi:hypothetical protein
MKGFWDTSSPNFGLNADLRAFVIEKQQRLAMWETKLKGKKIVFSIGL